MYTYVLSWETYVGHRVNALNFGSLLNTGNRPLYTMVGRFATFGRIARWWAALRPLALLRNDAIGALPEFSDFTLCKWNSL